LTWLSHALAFPCSFFALRWPGRLRRVPLRPFSLLSQLSRRARRVPKANQACCAPGGLVRPVVRSMRTVTTSPHTNGRAPAPLHDFDRRASPSSSNCESRRRRAGRACTLRVCATGRSVCGRNDPAGLLDLTRSRVRSESGKRTCACVQTARASGSSVDRPAQARDRPRQFGRRRW
jgi:hypothetical protein